MKRKSQFERNLATSGLGGYLPGFQSNDIEIMNFYPQKYEQRPTIHKTPLSLMSLAT